MSSRVALAAIVAAISVVACGVTPPTPAPSATGQAVSTPTAVSPAPVPSQSPEIAIRIDDEAYLAGDVFTIPVGDAGLDWAVPSHVPVMPNGQPAARVAFLPASCATGDVSIAADAPPEDAWETTLRGDGGEHAYTVATWPAAQVPECVNGQGRTYLDVAYQPFTPPDTIHLVASSTNPTQTLSAVEVVPVFTSADATQPALTTTGDIEFGPIPGPEKPRGTKPQPLATVDFGRATLPDGSSPTGWSYVLTGCGPVGDTPLDLTMRVGDAPPIEIGTCSEGGLESSPMSLPIPPDGTRVAILMAGGTTKSRLRVSEFQWRGDRP